MAWNDAIDPLERRIARIEQWGFQVRRAQSVADQFTPESASLLTAFARVFPWMESGVARSMSQAGIDPSHPVAQFAGKRALSMADRNGNGIRPIGQFTRTGGMIPDPKKLGYMTSQALGIRPTVRIPSPMQTAIAKGVVSPDEAQELQKAQALYKSPKLSGISFEEARDYLHTDPEDAERILQESEDFPGTFGQILEDVGVRSAEQKVQGVPGVGWTYNHVVKPSFRTASMVASWPLQEANAVVRNIYGVATGEVGLNDEMVEQTDLGIAAEQFFKDPSKVDVGSGLFVDPDSQVAKLRRERERQLGTIGGHSVTAGRILADAFFEPDTKPFDILSGFTDAGVAWYGDPLSRGLMGAGQAGLAKKTFQLEGRLPDVYKEAGLVNGVRKYVNQPTSSSFIASRTDRIKELTSINDPYEVAKSTGFLMPVEMTRRIAETSKTSEVEKIIRGGVESGSLRTTDQIMGSFSTRTAQKLNLDWFGNARILQKMPGKYLDYANKEDIAETMRRSMSNVRAGEETQRAVYNNIARARGDGALHNAVDDAFTRVGGILEKHGIADEGVRRMVTKRRAAQARSMLDDLITSVGANNPNLSELLSKDELFRGLSPHITLRIMSRYEEMPDPRVLRRLTSRTRWLTAKDTTQYLGPHVSEYIKKLPGVDIGPAGKKVGQLRAPFALAEHLMNDILKPSWLLRVAWPVRVIIEEQIRIANSPLDMDSMFKHPMSWFSVAMAKNHRLVGGGKYSADVFGRPIDELDGFKDAMFRGQGPWLRDPAATSKVARHEIINKLDDPPSFVYSWGNHINELHQNKIVQHVLESPNLDDAAMWFWRGGGKANRGILRDRFPGDTRFTTKDGARKYMEEISGNVRAVAGGNADIVNAIRTGKLRDQPILAATDLINPGFRKTLHSYLDDAPPSIDGVSFSVAANQSYDGAIDALFGFFMAAPTNKLSRSVVFKQAYWKHVEGLLPGATRTAQKKILSNARKAGMPAKDIKRLEALPAGRRGRLSQQEISDFAQGYALDDTKGLLYDLTERRQWADIMRIVIPFGDAYQEVVSRWAKLLWQTKGRPLRRGQQIITGARESGFFHENSFGEEVFTYPGSAGINNFLTGMPQPLSARVQGLNLIGNGLPGMGPVIQIPMAYILDKYPEAEELRDIMVPFGAPGIGEAGGTTAVGAALEFGPAWARKAYQFLSHGGQNKRLFANGLMATQSYLQSTGEYGNSRDEQARLMEDAEQIYTGKGTVRPGLLAIQALGAFMLPASPSLEEIIKDKSGNTLAAGILVRQFYDWAEDPEIGFEEATARFLDTYGPDAIGAIIPKTVNAYYGAPRTVEQWRFLKSHGDLETKYPSVVPFFGPQSGEFDPEIYQKTIVSGHRETLSPKEWRRLMDDRLGDYYYAQARAQVDKLGDQAGEQHDAWLRDYAANIQKEFPFWGYGGLPEKLDPERLVDEVLLAAKEPKLKKTEAGKAITLYAAARDQVVAAVDQYHTDNNTDSPATFRTAKLFAPYRQWLRDYAAKLIKRYPDFRNVWEQGFSREMGSDIALEKF